MENKDFDIKAFIGEKTGSAGKIATSGDASSVLLGFTLGTVLDFVIFVHSGIPPGAMGGLGAGTALGIKKGFDAWRTERRNRKEEQKQKYLAEQEEEKQKYLAEQERKNLPISLESKAEEIRKILLQKDDNKLLVMLDSDLELWRAKVIDDEQFDDELKKVITKYRESIR